MASGVETGVDRLWVWGGKMLGARPLGRRSESRSQGLISP